MREASSLVLIQDLIARGARVQAYDPAAMATVKEMVPADWMHQGKLVLTEHQYDALENVDALILVTEWKPFCYPDISAMKKLMHQPIIFDGRNQYDPKMMLANGFYYEGIGRGKTTAYHAGTLFQHA
jgi:UDPglucose 6-dehydrogenase